MCLVLVSGAFSCPLVDARLLIFVVVNGEFLG